VKQFTLEYWKDDGWCVGRLKEMPAVLSQGETLEELQAMILDAYHLMVEGRGGKCIRTEGKAGTLNFAVKRREFVRGLVDRGCYLKRHGANHDIYINPANGGVALLCSPSASCG